jgi:hypothetical protein
MTLRNCISHTNLVKMVTQLYVDYVIRKCTNTAINRTLYLKEDLKFAGGSGY